LVVTAWYHTPPLFTGVYCHYQAGKTVIAGNASRKTEDLVFLTELIEAGKIISVIDRRYPLSGVAEALRYYGEGHARGKVVIIVEHNNK